MECIQQCSHSFNKIILFSSYFIFNCLIQCVFSFSLRLFTGSYFVLVFGLYYFFVLVLVLLFSFYFLFLRVKIYIYDAILSTSYRSICQTSLHSLRSTVFKPM